MAIANVLVQYVLPDLDHRHSQDIEQVRTCSSDTGDSTAPTPGSGTKVSVNEHNDLRIVDGNDYAVRSLFQERTLRRRLTSAALTLAPCRDGVSQ